MSGMAIKPDFDIKVDQDGIDDVEAEIKAATDFVMINLKDNGVTGNRKEVEKKVRDMHQMFVPFDDLRVSVTNCFLRRNKVDKRLSKKKESSSSKPVKLADLKEPGKWVTILARVSQIWDSNSPSIRQKGLLEDDTGRIGFTIFAKSEIEPLEADTCYMISSVVTDEYNGRISIKLNKNTKVEEVDIDIAPSKPAKIEGAVVAILQNSGIVKRCPECNRILDRGECSKHGKQTKGVQDLILKAVIDNGREMYTVIGDKGVTEHVIGMKMDEATELAMDALDTGVIRDIIIRNMLGRHFVIEGKQNMGYIMVNTFTPIAIDPESVSTIIEMVEAI